ncbi:haloacid dehalogenase type II [Mycolicibacterium smegmatis]|uniref:haloacid dehalogenase type II n=1 Tax=Mycolicibacterium smegmatis TaxID=1772 RepID=UPI0020A2CD67|nr:haloacid dehalogenase type II [Mycolicibacterium smegmatis]MCP2623861.1 haloacid dehalogenase type II [Mycolicibacterium smegmatis]
MALRALVFDVFGTLVDWRSGVADAFRSADVVGDPDDLADAWRARYRPILDEVNDGLRPWGNFDELHLATLQDVLSERDIALSPDQLTSLVHAWHRLDPWPDVRDGLELLRSNFLIAPLSNGHVRLVVDLARHGDLRFDCILSAELAHAYKPAPETYLTAAHLLDVDPSEVMLVAAHPSDLAGARAAGLRTAFIDRPLEHGPATPKRSDRKADVSAADLHELARLLGDEEKA